MVKNLKQLNAFLKERKEFSLKTFGSVEERDHTAPLLHLKKEIQELIDNSDDELEWADVFLLLIDAADRKAGYTIDDLVNFASKKLAINKARTWIKQPDGTFRHFHAKDCPECGGIGGVDSGGSTPWGSPIWLPCPSCSSQK